uniref:Uncharacterized protein LOC117368683 n=1 Tax=Geotrypetes seraphini TaxID=260995 RepID=A0A6P8SHZ4_GEOSA|nr:uncharacterized protein LOC117368683 [Geotrypetes seraphini]
MTEDYLSSTPVAAEQAEAMDVSEPLLEAGYFPTDMEPQKGEVTEAIISCDSGTRSIKTPMNLQLLLLPCCLLLGWTEAENKLSISVKRDSEVPGRYSITCSLPSRSSVTWFRLYKDQNRVLFDLLPESSQLPRATFSVQNEGQYTCQYILITSSSVLQYYFSPVSDSVSVRDLPKPSISVEKDLGETGRYRVNCSETTISAEKRFTLFQGQHQKSVTVMKDGAGTLSLPRDANDTYWCTYYIIGEWLESPFSDPVVISEDVKFQSSPTMNPLSDDSQLILYISIPCAIILFILLLSVLLYYLSSRKKVTNKNPSRMTPWEEKGATVTPAAAAKTLNVPLEDPENVSVLVCEREEAVEEDRSHEDVTYAVLNPEMLRKKSPAPITPMSESSIYAGVKVK